MTSPVGFEDIFLHRHVVRYRASSETVVGAIQPPSLLLKGSTTISTLQERYQDGGGNGDGHGPDPRTRHGMVYGRVRSRGTHYFHASWPGATERGGDAFHVDLLLLFLDCENRP